MLIGTVGKWQNQKKVSDCEINKLNCASKYDQKTFVYLALQLISSHYRQKMALLVSSAYIVLESLIHFIELILKIRILKKIRSL